MTAYAAVDSAVEAVKVGAREYLTKPFDFDRLRHVLEAIRAELERRAQVIALESQVARQLEFCGMLGRSPAMQEVFSLIQRLAPHAKVVLIGGETGTGKELAARAFHQAGTRRTRPFVTINCSAVVDTLFESELFGHVRGAFTGAVESKPGVFEAAQGGTLFLDEVGELPMSVQAKLLRALEYGEVQRVGSPGARARVESRGAESSAGAAPLEEIEREHILEVLRQVNGNRMAAAKVLGISRRALYRRLERHNLADEAPPPMARRPL